MYHGERFNGISHLVGAVAALIGMLVLVIPASLQGDPWKIASFSIYGTSLVALYTFSTLYHSLRGEAKALFRKLDHHSIYLLIAGSYTPFTMVTLRDDLGYLIFGAVWTLAIIGMVYDSFPRRNPRIIPVIIYLVMGWLAVFELEPLTRALPGEAIVGLVLGGVFYTAGVFFYALSGATASGTCSCWPAAPATISRSCCSSPDPGGNKNRQARAPDIPMSSEPAREPGIIP
jgi:hemolysin III